MFADRLSMIGNRFDEARQLRSLVNAGTEYRNVLWWEDVTQHGIANDLLRALHAAHRTAPLLERVAADLTAFHQQVETQVSQEIAAAQYPEEQQARRFERFAPPNAPSHLTSSSTATTLDEDTPQPAVDHRSPGSPHDQRQQRPGSGQLAAWKALPERSKVHAMPCRDGMGLARIAGACKVPELQERSVVGRSTGRRRGNGRTTCAGAGAIVHPINARSRR
jgi:hypothetical protein